MQQAAPQLSAVVPCLDEQASSDELHRRVSAVRHEAVGTAHEIVAGDDGSRDRTRWRMPPPAERASRPVPVNPSRNHGPVAPVVSPLGGQRRPARHRGCPGAIRPNPAVMGLTTRVVWGVAPPLGPPPAEPVSMPCGFTAGHALTRVPVSRAA